MPRFYIDTDDNDLCVADEAGETMSGPEDARKRALSVLPDMARDKMPDGDRRTFSADVRDEHGTVIYRATLTLRGEWTAKPSA